MYNCLRREATSARSSCGMCEGAVHSSTPGIIFTVRVDVYTLVTKFTIRECSGMKLDKIHFHNVTNVLVSMKCYRTTTFI